MMFFFFFLVPQYGVGDNLRRYTSRASVPKVLADLRRGVGLAGKPELALDAAVACGYWQLFGGDGSLVQFPNEFAVRAAKQLSEFISDRTTEVCHLPENWDAANPQDAEDLVAKLLASRMDGWAAMETLHGVSADSDLSDALSACDEAIDSLDRALLEKIDFLATLTDTELLAQWRLALASPYRNPYPWWLAGEIEAAAIDVDRLIAVAERSLFGHASRGMAPAIDWAAKIHDQIDSRQERAADMPVALSSLASALQWKSPDSRYSASLRPQWRESSDGRDQVIVEFTGDTAESSLDFFDGKVVVLGSEGAVLERSSVDGREVVTVAFARKGVLHLLTCGDSAALSLHVMPGGGEWQAVVPMG